ncbi:MAG: toprim domain-containing protein [Patescibacteria group bacterium]|nr:toprim domain-containing protein [Patescibacteria group bacterium]
MKTWADFGFDPAAFEGHSGNVRVTCPQCSDHRRAFDDRCCSVHVTKRCWDCKHCGWRGGLAGFHPDDESRTREYTRPEDDIDVELSAAAATWLRNRGISDATIRRNRLGVGYRWFRKADRVEAAIRFPYRRNGMLINVKDRCLVVKDFTFGLNCELILFKLDDVAETTIICEGEMDALSFEEAGFPNAVSVPNGAREKATKAENSSAFNFLTADEERLSTVKKWIIATDADRPGLTLRDELSRRFGPEKCWLVTWPDGCKDANDVLVKMGVEALAQIVTDAKPCPVEGIFYGEDIAPLARDRHLHGAPEGTPPPWPSLAKLIKFRPGEMTVVTGYAHSGKSAWLDALIADLMYAQEWPLAIFSPENQPTSGHFNTFVGLLAGKPAEGPFKMPTEEYDQWAQFVRDRISWVYPEEDQTLDDLLARFKVLVYRRGIKAIVLDPWNELDHLQERNQREDQYLSTTLKRLKRFGHTHRVHIFIVAHPTNPAKNPRTGKYPFPTMHSIAGGAMWKNKADNGIVCYRDFDTNDDQFTVSVQKVKFKDVGRCGTCILRYKWTTGQFFDQGLSEFAGSKGTSPETPSDTRYERDDDAVQEDSRPVQIPLSESSAVVGMRCTRCSCRDFKYCGVEACQECGHTLNEHGAAGVRTDLSPEQIEANRQFAAQLASQQEMSF